MLALASVALAFAPSPLRTIPVQRHAVGAPVMVGGNTICGDIDADELSANLINYLVLNGESTKFEGFTKKTFAPVIAQACPEYADRSDDIFDHIDLDGSGDVDFAEFFEAVVAGPLFDDPNFAVVAWSEEEYGCKSDFVDADHQRLFNLINAITSAMKTGNIKKVQKSITGLKEYTVYHFDREIEMLSQLDKYPVTQLNAHKAAHKAFVEKVADFEYAISDEDVGSLITLVSGEMSQFLRSWLSQHIKATDMKFHKYF